MVLPSPKKKKRTKTKKHICILNILNIYIYYIYKTVFCWKEKYVLFESLMYIKWKKLDMFWEVSKQINCKFGS